MTSAFVQARTGFGLDDDQREVLEQVGRFAHGELSGWQRRMDDEEWWPEPAFPLLGEHGLLAHENLCLNDILATGNPELCACHIPGICEDRLVGALGLTEPGVGSDALSSMRTTARLDGDAYVLNATKLFITGGPIADVVLGYAETAPDHGAHGILAFVVPTDTPGFQVAQKLVKMGPHGSSRLYRGGKLWETGAGTTEIRLLIIARELLGR